MLGSRWSGHVSTSTHRPKRGCCPTCQSGRHDQPCAACLMDARTVTASNNAYTVAFDGAALTVTSTRNPGRVLRRIPIEELVSVGVKRAGTVLSGRIVVQGLGRPTPYDVIAFRARQEPGFMAVARAVQQQLSDASQRDAASAMTSMRRRAAAGQASAGDRALAMQFGARTSSPLPIVIGLACMLLIGVVAIWLLTR